MVSSTSAKPQNQPKHLLGFSLGMSNYNNKDLLASPLTYKGDGLLLEVAYEYQSMKTIQKIQIEFSKTRLTSSVTNLFGDHHIEDIRGRLAYVYYRHVSNTTKNKIVLFLGGQWNTYISKRDLFYSKGTSDLSGELLSSIDAAFLLNFNINGKNYLYYQIAWPIFAVALRPPYASGGSANSVNILTFAKFTRIENAIIYEHALSRIFAVRLKYEFAYYQLSKPRKTQTGLNNFLIQLLYKL